MPVFATPHYLGSMEQSDHMLFNNELSGVFLSAFTAIICVSSYIILKGYRRTPQQSLSRNVSAPVLREYQLPKSKDDSKYRRLYFKLHNIEEHPEVATEGRDLLISLLSEAITIAQPERRQDIFAIEHFTKEQLFSHVHKVHEAVGEEYNRYVEGRGAGDGRLIATDRHQTAKVLRNLAPLKLVDGAWLGRIHQAMTPFILRPITKQAWQVLSEELGDGNLDLNHVYLYNKLLGEVGVHLPAPYERDFIDHSHGMDNENIWRAAVIQLLISLFPQEFLPEILGYSLHFEGLNMETMVLSRELQELKLDAQYFLLHVSIDNAHSGHAMMAAHTVAEYMSHVTERETPAAASRTWRRIQAGYALSAHQSNSIKKDLGTTLTLSNPTSGLYDAEIVRVLVAKAAVARKTHSACRARIGGKPLAHWLDPEVLKSEGRTVQELSNAYPWIIKGRPQQSRLMREVARGGKMFGAFTVKETKLLEDWILSLGPNQQETDTTENMYWNFTNRDQESQQNLSLLHLAQAHKCDNLLQPDRLLWNNDVNICDRVLDLDLSQLDWAKISSLWFTHVSLLECWVAIPSRAATEIGATVIRILRAQFSLSCEEDGVSGMDEIERSSPPDLVAIGLEVSRRKGMIPLPTSLSDVLVRWPCPSAERLVSISRHPVQNSEALLGMTAAFLHLQRAVLQAPGFLCDQSRTVLDGIIDRETQGLQAGCELIEGEEMKKSKLRSGYQMAEEMIRQALTKPT
ncbi:ABC transporter [Pochonia chlamydosporia 170]|uniref:ABC transporter n=1 Tax=Pochonia chlamydosporia 170 TaxID=1380566 RepID=A0A179FI40_METCM|nr:ABC transporter [Pochonia chlamydosporia 170]OAQ65226.1 ABC transporter [Pochonia chlamydosporia 170]